MSIAESVSAGSSGSSVLKKTWPASLAVARNASCSVSPHETRARPVGSGALGVAYAAAGRFDAYWERHINVWDVLAGLVIATEAGGRTNDFLAGDAIQHGNRILASTPALFEELSRLLS